MLGSQIADEADDTLLDSLVRTMDIGDCLWPDPTGLRRLLKNCILRLLLIADGRGSPGPD